VELLRQCEIIEGDGEKEEEKKGKEESKKHKLKEDTKCGLEDLEIEPVIKDVRHHRALLFC
jgi:hypothetical protein